MSDHEPRGERGLRGGERIALVAGALVGLVALQQGAIAIAVAAGLVVAVAAAASQLRSRGSVSGRRGATTTAGPFTRLADVLLGGPVALAALVKVPVVCAALAVAFALAGDSSRDYLVVVAVPAACLSIPALLRVTERAGVRQDSVGWWILGGAVATLVWYGLLTALLTA